MSDRKQALHDLLAKIEAEDAQHSTDLPFWKVWTPESEDGNLAYAAAKAFDGSLDAAKALHEAVLPECKVRLVDHGAEFEDVGRWSAKVNWEHMEWKPTFTAAGPFAHSGQCNDPARAWLCAIIKALIAEADT